MNSFPRTNWTSIMPLAGVDLLDHLGGLGGLDQGGNPGRASTLNKLGPAERQSVLGGMKGFGPGGKAVHGE